MQAHSAITRRILVVGSKVADSNVQVIEDATRGWMFETVACSSVAEADKLLTEKDFAVIFCKDHFNGEGYAALLSAMGRRCRIPVVVMISDVNQDSVFQDAMALGAFGVVPSACSIKDVQWMVVRAAQQGAGSKAALNSKNASAPVPSGFPQ